MTFRLHLTLLCGAALLTVGAVGRSPGQTQQPTPPPTTTAPVAGDAVPQAASLPVPFRRFQFRIDPKTPLNELLPRPPAPRASAALPTDLKQVPEVEFQERPPANLPPDKALEANAHQLAKINFLNQQQRDHFLTALLEQRKDLAGMPFRMGDACRTQGERTRLFANAVGMVRSAMSGAVQTGIGGPPPVAPNPPAPSSSTSMNTPTGAPTALPSVGASEGEAPQVESPPVNGPGGQQPALPIQAPPAITEPVSAPHRMNQQEADLFWERFQKMCQEEDRTLAGRDAHCRAQAAEARIAALVQILGPASPCLRLGLVQYLSAVARPEATRALARLAIFDVEEDVRRAAVTALQVRRERDYTTILVDGLRYPWPAVARHATEAIVRLERTDLTEQLVAVLDEPDPRAPVAQEAKGRPSTVVRELVKVNHHRNCMLCHTAGTSPNTPSEALTGAVPTPGEPLPSFQDGYRSPSPDTLVRVDVTYLRQDFSQMQPVADAAPWPEMQRFDFLVRTREVNDREAEAVRTALREQQDGKPSPYQRAALWALRELTGQDTEPTAAAWRKVLRARQ